MATVVLPALAAPLVSPTTGQMSTVWYQFFLTFFANVNNGLITAGSSITVQQINGQYVLSISESGVTAGTYGSASTVPVFVINDQGIITNVTSIPIDININNLYYIYPGSSTQQNVTARLSKQLFVTDFGAIGDNVTDSTAAFQAAAASLSAGGELIIPVGNYVLTKPISFNLPILITGQGRSNTILKLNTVSENGFVINAECTVHGFTTDSSTVGRTADGITILNNSVQSSIFDVDVLHQGIGIHCYSAGVDLYNIHSSSNNSHGVCFDGSGGAPGLNETGIRFVQSNSNIGDGFHFIGQGAGIRMTVCTAAGNQGQGIGFVNPGSMAINDIWITACELSGNGTGSSGSNIDLHRNTGAIGNCIITGNFIESASGSNIWLSTDWVGCTITGNTISGAINYGIAAYGTDILIDNNFLSGNTTGGITFNGIRITATNNIVSNSWGTTNIGFNFESGCGALNILGGNVATAVSATNGSLPSGSTIWNVTGLSNSPSYTGTVTSVSGTTNQIDVSNGTTTPVISIDPKYTASIQNVFAATFYGAV
jgi:hypothetical protein